MGDLIKIAQQNVAHQKILSEKLLWNPECYSAKITIFS